MYGRWFPWAISLVSVTAFVGGLGVRAAAPPSAGDREPVGEVLAIVEFVGEEPVLRAAGVPLLQAGVVAVPDVALPSDANAPLFVIDERGEAAHPVDAVLLIDRALGLAFLRVPGMALTPIPSSGQVAPGEDVTIQSAPLLGLGVTVSGFVVRPNPGEFAVDAWLPGVDGGLARDPAGRPVAIVLPAANTTTTSRLVPLASLKRVRLPMRPMRMLARTKAMVAPLPVVQIQLSAAIPIDRARSADDALARGKALALSDPAGAEAAFLESLADNPFAAGAWANLALLRDTQSEWARSSAAYAVAAGLDRARQTDYCALAALGFVKAEAFDLAEAIAHRCLKGKPDHPTATAVLGAARAGQRDYESALRLLRSAVGAEPQLTWVHGVIAAALHQRGDLPGAIAAYRNAIAARPTARLQVLYADALHKAGSKPEAVAALEAARRLATDANDLNAVGDAFAALGMMPAAKRAWQAAVDMSPERTDIHRKLTQ